jgi:hypothetical protein
MTFRRTDKHLLPIKGFEPQTGYAREKFSHYCAIVICFLCALCSSDCDCVTLCSHFLPWTYTTRNAGGVIFPDNSKRSPRAIPAISGLDRLLFLWNVLEASPVNKPALACVTLPRTVGIHTSCEQFAFLNVSWVKQRVCSKSYICRSKLLIVTSTTSEQYSVVIKQLFCFTHERVRKCVVLCQYSVQNTKASSKCYNYTITIIQCSFTRVLFVL